MKMHSLILGQVAALALVTLSAQSAETTLQFTPKPGSKMKIDGTANMIHTKWRVQTDLIAGKLEVGPGFPVEPGQEVKPGPVAAKANVFIPVRSLKSVEEDGSHYSDAMDNVMYEHMNPEQQPRIYYHLTNLVLKEAPKSKDAPYLFESKGDLAVAGVTNQITMPVQVLPLGDKKLKVSGEVSVKMTDFKMTPPTALAGALKVGDQITLSFDWMVGQHVTAAAAK